MKKSLQLLAILSLMACEKYNELPTSNDPYEGYELIGEQVMVRNDYTVRLLSKDLPHVGYNNMVVKVKKTDNSQPATDAEVVYWPIFKTATMTHGTYVEHRDSATVAGTYQAQVVFTRPTAIGDSWILHIATHENGTNWDTASFELPVIETVHPRVALFSYTSSPWLPYKEVYLVLVDPIQPTGEFNDLKVLAFYRQQDFVFSHLPDLTIKTNLVFHGSNYLGGTLQHQNRGLYYRQVGFREPGLWRVKCTTFDQSGREMDNSAFFDLDVQ